jgi:hypothetical protein
MVLADQLGKDRTLHQIAELRRVPSHWMIPCMTPATLFIDHSGKSTNFGPRRTS